MSTQFVRYTPDIEATDPYFDENSQIVIDKIEEYIAGSVTTEGTGRAVRDAHAKGYGVVKAEVEILGQLPAEYAQGIYAVPGKHGRSHPLLQRTAARWTRRATRPGGGNGPEDLRHQRPGPSGGRA